MPKLQAVVAIVIAIVIGVVGQIFIKKALNSMTGLDFSGNALSTYMRIFSSPYVIIGVVTYVLSILFWVYGLTKVDLSYAYPFLAISYILVIIGSWYFLGETITALRIIGVSIICFGVIIVANS
jgi:multidrug transporter EmrE-like cation transporter